MRMFKNRPLLATLLVLGLVGAASGAAYAVDRIFLHVDPDKSAPEIERDVKSQLEQAGVPAEVTADKTDGQVKITIASTDMNLPDKLREMGAIVIGDGSGEMTGDQTPHRIAIEPHTLDADTKDRVTKAVTSQPVIDALVRHGDAIAAIRGQLVLAGVHADVEAAGNDIVVKVK